MIDRLVLSYNMFMPSYIYIVKGEEKEKITLNNKTLASTSDFLYSIAEKNKINKIEINIQSDDFYHKIKENLLQKNSMYEVSRI